MTVWRGGVVGLGLVVACTVAACASPSPQLIAAQVSSPRATGVVRLPFLPLGLIPAVALPATAVPMVAVLCTNTAGPPTATRLTTLRDYGDIHLNAVDPAAQPKVSAKQAFERIAYEYQLGVGVCGIAEVLAYWSSATPGTIPPQCVPQTTQTSASPPPAACPVTPLYTNVLAWVFTWRMDCVPAGGPYIPPGMSRPTPHSWPPLSCSAITLVNAATGEPGVLIESGGF
jgi:hypothetical protein